MADASYMDKLQAQAFRAGITKGSDEARKFFASKLKEVKSVNRQSLMKDPNFNVRARPLTGRLFIYFYDPKHKKTLPYYDRFPLCIPVQKAKGGFYGLNLHYLHPLIRAQFLDELYDITNNDKHDRTTKMRITYNLLKSSARMRFFKPCLKHYLSGHIQSPLLLIEPADWEIAIFLPTESFRKVGKETVWNESRSKF